MHAYRCFLIVFILLMPWSSQAYPTSLNFQKTDGSIISYHNFQNGKPMLIDGMATWCGPCQEAMPTLVQVHNFFGDNISMASISLDPGSDNLNALLSFKHTYNASWIFGLDYNNSFQEYFNIQGLPQILIFYPNGTLSHIFPNANATQLVSALNSSSKFVGQSNQLNPLVDSLLGSTAFRLTIAFVVVSLIAIPLLNKRNSV